MTAEEMKRKLKLEAHPMEGGWFRQTYRSALEMDAPQGRRSAGTAIYYLLEPGTFSEMHVLPSDEVSTSTSVMRWRCCNFGPMGTPCS